MNQKSIESWKQTIADSIQYLKFLELLFWGVHPTYGELEAGEYMGILKRLICDPCISQQYLFP